MRCPADGGCLRASPVLVRCVLHAPASGREDPDVAVLPRRRAEAGDRDVCDIANSTERRRAIHGSVAQALERVFGERLDEFTSVLAYHYALAEDWEKAQEYLFKAGDQAGRMAADAEALEHYRRAEAAYTKVPTRELTPLQRATLDRKLGQAFPVERARTLLEMGHRLGDAALVDEATKVFEQTGARVDLAFALHARAGMAPSSGPDVATALRRFDQAIAALAEVKAEYALGVACRQRARLHAQLGRPDQARADLATARRCFSAVGAAADLTDVEHESVPLGEIRVDEKG